MPSPSPYLYTTEPLQSFSQLLTPTTKISWDEVNRQVVLVSGSLIHLVPINPIDCADELSPQTFPPTTIIQIPSEILKSPIKEAKMSPNKSKLAIFDQDKQIVLLNLSSDNVVSGGISVVCKDVKQRETKILGFYWINDSHILIVLNTSIQFIQLKTSGNTMQSKVLKTFSLHIRSFKYSPESGILLVAVYGKESSLFPFRLFDLSPTVSSITKLNRFDLSMGQSEPEIQENEVHLAVLYGKCWCIHISTARQEMTIYKIQESFVKMRVFNLFSQGTFQVNIVDSLIVLHNNEDQFTMTYDIFAKQDAPISPPMSITTHSQISNTEQKHPVSLYSDGWIVINPNYIIDRTTGFIYRLDIAIEHMPISIRNKSDLIKFLFRRTNSKRVLLQKVKSFITERKENLRSISSIFKLVNRYYLSILIKRETERQKRQSLQISEILGKRKTMKRDSLESLLSPLIIDPSLLADDEVSNSNSPRSSIDESAIVTSLGYPVIEQIDMYTHVLNPIDEDSSDDVNKISTGELISLVVEYIRSLKIYNIPVQHLLQKFLIDLMIKNSDIYLLHQFVQYKVIDDSIPTAWQILHISSEYEPAYQIALDMMSRLQAYENICEILISKKEISQALQIMHRHKVATIPPKVIFDAVVQMRDTTLFFNTYEIIQKCNLRNRGSVQFTKEEKCEEFVRMYQDLQNGVNIFSKHQATTDQPLNL